MNTHTQYSVCENKTRSKRYSVVESGCGMTRIKRETIWYIPWTVVVFYGVTVPVETRERETPTCQGDSHKNKLEIVLQAKPLTLILKVTLNSLFPSIQISKSFTRYTHLSKFSTSTVKGNDFQIIF